MTAGDELRQMAALFDYLCWDKRAARLRDIAAEHDRMERELTRLMQEGREAHAATIAGSKEVFVGRLWSAKDTP